MSGSGSADTVDTVLTNLGEKMSDEEVDELLKAVDTSSGEINYTGKPNRLHATHRDQVTLTLAIYRARPDHSRELTSWPPAPIFLTCFQRPFSGVSG